MNLTNKIKKYKLKKELCRLLSFGGVESIDFEFISIASDYIKINEEYHNDDNIRTTIHQYGFNSKKTFLSNDRTEEIKESDIAKRLKEYYDLTR